MQQNIVLTGDRPTGPLHLGHFVGSIRNRLSLQEKDKQFLMVADLQALTDHAREPEKVREAVFGVTLDNISCGVDPKKTVIFIQSQIPEIQELAFIFMNLVSVTRLEQNPTVKTEMKQKGMKDIVPAGFLVYPISQAADILSFKADFVPVGEDQLPMIEQTNEIVERFNNYYPATPLVFKKVKALVPNEGEGRLPGIDGKAKMGKSLGNAIYLSDSAREVEKKVMQMYTDPGHIHASDPGKIEGNIVFTYLAIFDPDQDAVTELKNKYQKGGLGDVEIKKRLIKVLNDTLEPIRIKRENLLKDKDFVRNVLKEGTEKAKDIVRQTFEEVNRAVKINYFT